MDNSGRIIFEEKYQKMAAKGPTKLIEVCDDSMGTDPMKFTDESRFMVVKKV